MTCYFQVNLIFWTSSLSPMQVTLFSDYITILWKTKDKAIRPPYRTCIFWTSFIQNGGTQANVIPAHAKTEIMFRTVSKRKTIQDKIKQIIDKKADIEYKFVSDPVALETLEGFEQTVQRQFGHLSHSGSDAAPCGPGRGLQEIQGHRWPGPGP